MITGSLLALFPWPGVALGLFENEKSRPTFSSFLVSNAVDRFFYMLLPTPYELARFRHFVQMAKKKMHVIMK